MADIEIDTKPFLFEIDVRDENTGIAIGWFRLAQVPAVEDILELRMEKGGDQSGRPVVDYVDYTVRGRSWNLTQRDTTGNVVELRVTPITED